MKKWNKIIIDRSNKITNVNKNKNFRDFSEDMGKYESNEYYKNKNNVEKDILIRKSDIIIIATPHKAYKNLKINKKKVLIDIWGLIEKK